LTDGEEVPSQRFCDLNASDGSGVCVVNDSKYGFAVEGSSLRATLIRSSYDPDPLPEIGEHTMRFGIRPHGAAWTPTDDVKAGVAFNQPLRVVGTNVHTGSLPPASSWLGVEQANVVLAAVKRAEDGNGVVLRVYETDGRDTECTIAVNKAFGVSSAVEVDLLEQPLAKNTAQLADGRLTVKIPAYGITSVRLT
jgi:alpha-mannosidase